jgi:hypothetical protein
MKKRFALALSMVALTASSMLRLHPGPASARDQPATIQVLTAKLATGGVDLTFSYACPPPDGSVQAALDQNDFGNGLFGPATCDDQTHQVTFFIAGPYVKGPDTVDITVNNGNGTAFKRIMVQVNLT